MNCAECGIKLPFLDHFQSYAIIREGKRICRRCAGCAETEVHDITVRPICKTCGTEMILDPKYDELWRCPQATQGQLGHGELFTAVELDEKRRQRAELRPLHAILLVRPQAVTIAHSWNGEKEMTVDMISEINREVGLRFLSSGGVTARSPIWTTWSRSRWGVASRSASHL